MGNVIHRETTEMKVKCLVTKDNFPEIFTVIRKEDGWHGTDKNGKTWYFFIAHLRNENYFQILEQK